MNKHLEDKIETIYSLMGIYMHVQGEIKLKAHFEKEILELNAIKKNYNKYTYIGTNYHVNSICDSVYYNTFAFEEKCVEYSLKIKELRKIIKRFSLNWVQKVNYFSKKKISTIFYGAIGGIISYIYPMLFSQILGEKIGDIFAIRIIAGIIFSIFILRYSIIVICFIIVQLHILILKMFDYFRPIEIIMPKY